MITVNSKFMLGGIYFGRLNATGVAINRWLLGEKRRDTIDENTKGRPA